MAAIFQDIVDGLKDFMAEFEKIIKDGVSGFAHAGDVLFTDVKSGAEDVIRDTKARVSGLIQTLRSHFQSHTVQSGGVGPEVASFWRKIEAVFRDAIDAAQAFFDRIKSAIKFTLTASKDALEAVGSKVVVVTKDVADILATGAKDFLAVLKDVGAKIGLGLIRVSHFVANEVVVSADFVCHHGLQIAEVATISVFSPAPFISFAVAGAIIYAATAYEAPKKAKRPQKQAAKLK